MRFELRNFENLMTRPRAMQNISHKFMSHCPLPRVFIYNTTLFLQQG